MSLNYSHVGADALEALVGFVSIKWPKKKKNLVDEIPF